MSYRPAGSWCDVCVLPDGRIAFVRAEPSMVICEIDGAHGWAVLTPSPLLFLRCAALADGTVAAIGKANDPQGSALLILRGKVLNLGATAGNNPVALTATHAYIVTGPAVAHRTRLDDGFSEPIALPWTSQGIRDVLPDGTIVSADSTYAAPVRGVNFGEYQTRGDLTVGQHGYGIGVLIGSQFFLARSGSTNYGVHGAQSGSRIAVCAYTEAGSYYQDFTPPYPVAPVVAPPAPVPVPQPTPIPEPKPVSTPNLLLIAQATAGKHPDLVKANTKDACGQLTEYIAQALHLNDTGWGLLSKSAGENNYRGHAVDAVIYQPTQQVIDLMSGAGDRDLLTPTSSADDHKKFDHDIRIKWDEVGKRPDNHWMAPFQPEGTPPPATPPPAPPPPPVDSGSDLAALRKQIDLLSGRLSLFATLVHQLETNLDASDVFAHGTEKRVAALESKPAPTYTATGTTSRAFGHSHTINVTLEPQA